MFAPDLESKYFRHCDKCKMQCEGCRQKWATLSFSAPREQVAVHHGQVGGANDQLPINILKRSITTYYSINFSLHKNFYNLYDAKKTVDDFPLAFERVFAPGKKVKSQGLMQLINYQRDYSTQKQEGLDDWCLRL